MIDREEALRLARREVERRGLPWAEPVSVSWGPWNYQVWTNYGSKGGNVIVKVNRRSGQASVLAMTPK